jgi:hypothetical protein
MPLAPDVSPQGCPCTSASFLAFPDRLPGRSIRRAMPPGEQALRSTPHRDAEHCPVRRSAPESGLDRAPCRLPGSTPSLHRYLSTASHPRMRFRRVRPCRQRLNAPADQAEACAVCARAPIDSRAFLHRRVRSVIRCFQRVTPYTSMGFVPLRGFRVLPLLAGLPGESGLRSLAGFALHRGA